MRYACSDVRRYIPGTHGGIVLFASLHRDAEA